jgi:N-acetylneuraminic acid mutarotase
MRCVPAFFLLATLVGCAGAPPDNPAPGAVDPPSPPGVWSEKARIPSPDVRSEAATVFAAGRIYVLGGLARGLEASTLNQEYDPATDMWRERAPMPAPLSHPNAAVLNDKIYVVGGFLSQVHVGAQDAAFEYDPAADSWRRLAPLPTARGSVGVVALDGKIHAVGGRTIDRVTSALHDVYDPATNSWTSLAPLPTARDHFATAVVDGKIHVIGGRLDTPVDNTGLHDVYDPATNSWSSGVPMLTPRSGGAAVLYKGLIVVAGGECRDFKPFVETEGFNVETGQWQALAPMPIGKHGITGATDGRLIYIAGGNPECGLSMSSRLITFELP